MGGAELRRTVAGLDLGGTKLLGVVIGGDEVTGDLIEARVRTPEGTDAVLEGLCDLARHLDDAVPSGEPPPAALGVGAPGLVDRAGVFRAGPNLPEVVDVDLAGELGRRLNRPVTADNDATAAAWGEFKAGAAAGVDHAVMVTLGTGIGTGIVADGRVIRGINGFAGEAGHMVIDPAGPPCPCGQRGCWERYASGSGLGRLGRDAAVGGQAPEVVARAGGNPESVRGEHVTAAAAEGDRAARAVLADWGWWLAQGIANLVNLLDTEMVVLGGGLIEAGDLVLEPTRAAFDDLVLGRQHRPAVEILPASLGERAGAIGAALLAADRRGPAS